MKGSAWQQVSGTPFCTKLHTRSRDPRQAMDSLWKATARRIGATPRAKTYDDQSG